MPIAEQGRRCDESESDDRSASPALCEIASGVVFQGSWRRIPLAHEARYAPLSLYHERRRLVNERAYATSLERKKKGGPVSRVLYPFRGRRHPSSPTVSRRLRATNPWISSRSPFGTLDEASELLFIARPCSQRGLPCRRRCRRRGGLLPRLFTLTRGPLHGPRLADRIAFARVLLTSTRPPGSLFSVALSVRPSAERLSAPRFGEGPGVTRRCALVSPDFPPRRPKASGDGARGPPPATAARPAQIHFSHESSIAIESFSPSSESSS